MSSKKFTVRWGILATGGIAKCFTKDLLVNPETRGIDSIVHTVVAAASSSSKSRAEEFLRDLDAPSYAKAYGSYADFVKDPNIDAIYVATPHSHHFQNVMLCLEAGKNILCEKAFTVNAAQAKLLVKKAKEKVSWLCHIRRTSSLSLMHNLRRTYSLWRPYGPATSHSQYMCAI